MKQEDNARRAEFIWSKIIADKEITLFNDTLLSVSRPQLKKCDRSNEFDPTGTW